MQLQVKTQTTLTPAGDPELVMRFLLLPRGSGNRNAAKRLAAELRGHELMAPYIKRVQVGASSVVVRFRSCAGLARAFLELRAQEAEKRDVAGQLGLFGDAALG